MSSEKILIVEDDVNILFFLERMLSKLDYDLEPVSSGEEALSLIDTEQFDLAILDVNLGSGLSGMDVLGYFQENSPDTIIILLTGNGTLETAIEALRMGAHDYLLKPVMGKQIRNSVLAGLEKRKYRKEMQARQSVLDQLEQNLEESLMKLRGTAALPQDRVEKYTSSEAGEDEIRFLRQGRLEVDLPRRMVSLEGQYIELSPTEYDLLLYLLREMPRIVPAQELVRQIQGYNLEESEAGTITRTHIYRLRQKFKDIDPEFDIIRTVRGVGYTVVT